MIDLGQVFRYDGNTIVIKSYDARFLKQFFEKCGFNFVLEKHGNGPDHWAAEIGDKVLEIYILKSQDSP